MYPRIITSDLKRSFFLFGPRGTGKSSWLRQEYKKATYLDLLDDEIYRQLLAKPERLREYIVASGVKRDWIIIDEVQRVPALLNEVHRLIETQDLKFILSGSSARSLKRKGVNLLAGRAATRYMYPLTSIELAKDFSLSKALRLGMLPEVWDSLDPEEYLKSYLTTYLKEEVQQEGLTRNLGAFSRFLEVASLSQASPLNVSEVARSVGVDNKTAENYFVILEDLLLATRVPVFRKHAKREVYKKSKFFIFDVGVFRSLRPKGPLDSPEFIDGAALETLFFQEVRAVNDYFELGYSLYYWRTKGQLEVDLVLYGEKGILAFEIKRSREVRKKDLKGLRAFMQDYPMAKAYLLYGGERVQQIDGITVLPFKETITGLNDLL